MGIKTTATVLVHIIADSIRHPLTASTIYVDPAGRVRVIHKKETKKERGAPKPS